MSYRTVIFEQITTGCFAKSVCTWLLILHARIQSLKESGVVTMESFSIELIDVIVHKRSKKGVFEILEELIRKHPQQNTASVNRV